MGELKARKILVTGGAGFIGTHLCRALIEEGAEVRALDVRSPREPVAGVDYARGDVRHALDLESAVMDVDTVFHLAAMVGTAACRARPFESYETNVMGTIRVLEAVRAESDRRGGPVRVIFAGSAAVYGISSGGAGALSEALPLLPPVSHSGAQKLAAEQAVRLYALHHGTPTLTLRLFKVYGRGQDAGAGVVARFVSVARKGGPFPLLGDGTQTRDFVAVEDVADAFVRAAELDRGACDGSAVNVGTGRAASIRELAGIVAGAAGCALVTEPAPARTDDVAHSRADASRARRILGWEAGTALEPGIQELLKS